jgi:transposase
MFMTSKRYTEEFKIEAVKQVTDRGYSVADVAQRLGTTTHSLYAWIKKYGKANPGQAGKADLEAENARLKADLRRMTDELNDRPRKTLRFSTPKEIIQRSVALTS